MKHLIAVYKFIGNNIINAIILIGTMVVPASATILSIKYFFLPNVQIFLAFIFLLVVERTWETFFSSKERKEHKLYGDWTLPIVSIAYILMVIGTIWEFFIIQRNLEITITIIGLIIFISSFILRFYCMNLLKDQWSIHAVGAKKINKVFLISEGPYKYIRHPIYLGVMLEVLSLPLIWNAYFSFIFALVINIPLQILRAYLEEYSTIRKLGKDYIEYRNTVPAFLPIKFK